MQYTAELGDQPTSATPTSRERVCQNRPNGLGRLNTYCVSTRTLGAHNTLAFGVPWMHIASQLC